MSSSQGPSLRPKHWSGGLGAANVDYLESMINKCGWLQVLREIRNLPETDGDPHE